MEILENYLTCSERIPFPKLSKNQYECLIKYPLYKMFVNFPRIDEVNLDRFLTGLSVNKVIDGILKNNSTYHLFRQDPKLKGLRSFIAHTV